MNLFTTVHKLLGTSEWRRTEAEAVSSIRFGAFSHDYASIVLDCLVEMLGVTFEQLYPDTDLAKDLGADEDEPEWISARLKELGIPISPQQVADARTVGGLIESAARIRADLIAPCSK